MAGTKSTPKRERSSAYAELTPAEIKEALERRAAQQVEYGTWDARQDIPVPFGTQLAYAKGDPVPVSNVKRWDYDLDENYCGAVVVVGQDTEEGKALINPNNTATIALGLDGIGAQHLPASMTDAATTDTVSDKSKG